MRLVFYDLFILLTNLQISETRNSFFRFSQEEAMSQQSTFRRLVAFSCRFLPFIVLLLLANDNRARGQTSPPQTETLPELAAGELRKGAIRGLSHQKYPIKLEAGQYLKVTVTQEAMNMYLRFFDPEGKEIAQVDRDRQGPNAETLETVAEKPGAHTLVITAMDSSDLPAPYEARLVEARAATPREQQLAKAEKRQCDSQALRGNGKFDAAIAPALESLALRKEHLGQDPVEQFDYADILNHLGNVYREAGDFLNAQPCYEQARDIWKKLLRPAHPHITTVLSNLGLNYQGLGDFDQAEALQRFSHE